MKTPMTTKRSGLMLGLMLFLLVPQAAQCFYNPSTGRWLNRDPISEAGGINTFAFTGNDPINESDPYGLCCCVKRGPIVTFRGNVATQSGWVGKQSDEHVTFQVDIWFEPDGTKEDGLCCKVADCAYSQLVAGYRKVDGPAKAFLSGAGLPINAKTFVDDGYSLTKNNQASDKPYHFATTDAPGMQAPSSGQLTYYLQFKAIVTDTTTGKPVAKNEGYWIKIDGPKFPRTLSHGGMN